MTHILRIIILWLSVPSAFAAIDVPVLRKPVSDLANLVDISQEKILDQKLKQLQKEGGSQLAILTIPSLDEESIEGFSIRVTDKWQLGDQEKDNGILLLIAKKERLIRIEVGQGLEGVLTDAYASRIIRNVISPAFKTGDFTGGIISGIASILSYTDPNFELSSRSRPSRSRRRGNDHPLVLILIIFFVIVSQIFGRFRSGRSFRRSRGYWGHQGGFSGGGGGGFGGGFGGGGGGFSGGGSSGGW